MYCLTDDQSVSYLFYFHGQNIITLRKEKKTKKSKSIRVYNKKKLEILITKIALNYNKK